MATRLIVWIFLCLISNEAFSQVLDIAHSDEKPTRTLFIRAQQPKALVLLYPGGGGQLHIRDDGQIGSRHTFVRSADQWAQYHIDAVLVDTPYDLGDLKRGDMRDQKDHLQRVAETIAFYRSRTRLPIWIFGHSMGTSTASNFANRSPQIANLLSGIIVAGTVRTATINDEVNLPILAIHHQDDACRSTPISASRNLIEGRSQDFVSRLEIIKGGVSEGKYCESFAYHGFNQTEDELIKRAAQFILSH